jgi:hypothetical protein
MILVYGQGCKLLKSNWLYLSIHATIKDSLAAYLILNQHKSS